MIHVYKKELRGRPNAKMIVVALISETNSLSSDGIIIIIIIIQSNLSNSNLYNSNS